VGSPQNKIFLNGGQPQILEWGRGEFFDRPHSAPTGGDTVLSTPASFCSHISQWAFLKSLLAPSQNPPNIFPESTKLGLNFEISIFSIQFLRAPLPPRLSLSTSSLLRFVELQTVKKFSKFCASSSYGSEDTSRQSLYQKIWAKNKAEKN